MSKTIEMQKVKVAISSMDMNELRQVSEYLNFAMKQQIRQAARQFSAGDTVQLTHPKVGSVKATVLKVKPKMVEIRTEGGMIYNVAGTLLKAI